MTAKTRIKSPIPLIIPRHIDPRLFMEFFQESINQNRFSNHGPCYEIARAMIKKELTFNTMVCNATIGLELALRARFQPGTKVLVPNFTFIATLLAVQNAGMIPVIGRVDEQTWSLERGEIEKHKGPAIVVSPFGHGIDFNYYESTGYPIVYDLAGGWGIPYKGENVAVYSWHATKRFAVGEGAAIVSNDFRLINEIDRLSNFGYTNAKISEIHCAIACALMKHGIPSYKENYSKYWTSIDSEVLQRCLGESENISMICFKVGRFFIHKLQTQNEFMVRRYYYPLLDPTLNENMDTIFAFPRDTDPALVAPKIRNLLAVL